MEQGRMVVGLLVQPTSQTTTTDDGRDDGRDDGHDERTKRRWTGANNHGDYPFFGNGVRALFIPNRVDCRLTGNVSKIVKHALLSRLGALVYVKRQSFSI